MAFNRKKERKNCGSKMFRRYKSQPMKTAESHKQKPTAEKI
jgi:hypothetical protein